MIDAEDRIPLGCDRPKAYEVPPKMITTAEPTTTDEVRALAAEVVELSKERDYNMTAAGSRVAISNIAKAAARLATDADDLRQALIRALEWIDAVPEDTQLPAMPGFDRDDVNELIERTRNDK